eukprot:TRINITY_DN74892_c0_g1_i1.p1 TRINITY_DN74892_c0_g1~~TRINITY_DN74892_c0_g1_i1.p1  ORF type:complete len:555 (+),score=128.18 TRINITY_DN74892_c0_g1_i1:87-1667(+)
MATLTRSKSGMSNTGGAKGKSRPKSTRQKTKTLDELEAEKEAEKKNKQEEEEPAEIPRPPPPPLDEESIRLRREKEVQKDDWRAAAEFLVGPEGRSRHANKAILEATERYGRVPLEHIVCCPAMREKGAHEAPLRELVAALRLSSNLEVIGPPFYIKPQLMLEREFALAAKVAEDLEATLKKKRDEYKLVSTNTLKRTAKEEGAEKEHIDVADDRDDTKAYLVDLCIKAYVHRTTGTRHVTMQFNMRADGNMQADFADRVPNEALSFQRRGFVLLDEIKRVNPSILCVQGMNHYGTFWREKLEALGFDGFFFPKYDATNSEAFRCPPGSYRGKPSDGCGIFILKQRLRISRKIMHRFTDLCSEDVAEVCAMAELKEAEGEGVVGYVAVAELTPGGDEAARTLRKQQAQALAKAIKAFGPSSPLIICADLQEELVNPAGGKSAVFEALRSVLKVKSVYADGQGFDPPYTCIDGKFRSCQDYILSSDDVRAFNLWTVPELPDDALPAINYPSNHLALASELRWGLPKA